MTLEGSALRVSLDVVGTKELRLFDVQGHLVHVERFAGNAMTVGLDRFARGNYVARLAAGGKTLAIRKVSLGN